MGFNINNKLDDTLLFGGIGAVLICIGLVYKPNSEIDDRDYDYLARRLNDPYHLRTVGGDRSKTRRKNKY